MFPVTTYLGFVSEVKSPPNRKYITIQLNDECIMPLKEILFFLSDKALIQQ